MSEWWGVALYTVQSEEARPHHSRIVQDKKYQYSQRLSFTGTQGKFRLFSTSLTSKRKTHMKLAWCHMPLNPIIERQRLAEYWLQGQPRLQRVWQQPAPHGENSSQRNWQQERNHTVSCDEVTTSHSCWVGRSIENKFQTLLRVCTRPLLYSTESGWAD